MTVYRGLHITYLRYVRHWPRGCICTEKAIAQGRCNESEIYGRKIQNDTCKVTQKQKETGAAGAAGTEEKDEMMLLKLHLLKAFYAAK